MTCVSRLFVAASLASSLAGSLTAQFFPFTTDTTSTNPLGSMAVHGPRVDVQDFDGDGYPDFVVNNYYVGQSAVFRNRGQAGTGFDGAIVPNFNGDDLFAGDLDGDGFADLVQNNYTSLGWLLNDGTGTFPGPLGTETMTTGIIKDLARIDVDGDGKDEILVGRRIPGSGGYYFLEIYGHVAGGAGTPGSLSLLWSVNPTGYQSTYEVFQVIDLDRDGDQDIVTCTGETLRNDTPQNAGATVVFTALPYAYSGSNYSVASGDLNGDGRFDLAFANGNNSTQNDVQTYVQDFACGNTGAYSLGAATIWTIPTGNGGQAYWIDMADLDGDGLDDVILGYSGGNSPGVYKLAALRSLGDGQLVDYFDLIGGSGNQASMASGAADFDNDGDIDLVGFNGSAVTLFRNDSAARVEEVFTDAPSPVAPHFLWVNQASQSAAETGAYDAPYRTLTAALGAATAGDAVMVLPGRYNACSDPDEQTSPAGQTRVLDGVQLIGVTGPEQTFLYGMRFLCQGGARLSGFTLQDEGVLGEAVVRVKDATVVGNRLFGGSPMSGIVVMPGTHTAYLGSNIVHGFRDGILVEDGSSTAGYPSARIQNNTLVRNSIGLTFGVAEAIAIRNNLVVDNSVYGVHRDCSGTNLNALDVDYNWVSLNGMGDYVTTVPLPTGTCNSPLTLTAGPTDMLSTWSMADFVDADGLDFHLVPTSAAVGRGEPLGVAPWLSIDVDGDPRSSLDFATATPFTLRQQDIGADEANSSRLGVATGSNGWTMTTTMACAGCFEGKVMTWRPGLLSILDSLVLVDLSTQLAAFPISSSDPSTHTMPRAPWLPVGVRLYVQAAVIDMNVGRLSFTNPVVLTHF